MARQGEVRLRKSLHRGPRAPERARACAAIEDARLMEERRETADGDGDSASSRGDRPMSPNSASLATLRAGPQLVTLGASPSSCGDRRASPWTASLAPLGPGWG